MAEVDVRGGHEHHLLRHLVALVPAVGVAGLVQNADEVHLAALHLFDQLFRGAGSDPKADFGVFHPELMHQAGQTEKAERFQRADVQAALQFGILAQGAAGVVDGIQNAVGVFQKALTLCGQDHPLAHAVEQAHTQLFFQRFDLHGNGRLGIAQTFRCLGKALELGGTDQGVQLAHFHGKAPLLLRFLNHNFIFMNLNHAYVYVKLNVSTRQVKI